MNGKSKYSKLKDNVDELDGADEEASNAQAEKFNKISRKLSASSSSSFEVSDLDAPDQEEPERKHKKANEKLKHIINGDVNDASAAPDKDDDTKRPGEKHDDSDSDTDNDDSVSHSKTEKDNVSKAEVGEVSHSSKLSESQKSTPTLPLKYLTPVDKPSVNQTKSNSGNESSSSDSEHEYDICYEPDENRQSAEDKLKSPSKKSIRSDTISMAEERREIANEVPEGSSSPSPSRHGKDDPPMHSSLVHKSPKAERAQPSSPARSVRSNDSHAKEDGQKAGNDQNDEDDQSEQSHHSDPGDLRGSDDQDVPNDQSNQNTQSDHENQDYQYDPDHPDDADDLNDQDSQDESVECPLCESQYEYPILLQCTHTFCKECIGLLMDTSEDNFFECPICNTTVTLDESDEQLFCPNFLKLRALEKSNEDPPICGSCEADENVDKFCEDCGDFLCNDCAAAHLRVKYTKDHTLSPIEPGRVQIETQKKYFCSEHPKEVLTVYCLKCDSSVCRECALKDHAGNGHDCGQVTEAAQANREVLKTTLGKLKEYIPDVRSKIEETEKIKTDLAEQLKNVKHNINESTQRIIQYLKDREVELFAEMDELHKEKIQNIANAKEELETSLDEVNTYNTFLRKLVRHKNDVEMLQMRATLKKKLRELQQIDVSNLAIKEEPFVFHSNEDIIKEQIKVHGLKENISPTDENGNVMDQGGFSDDDDLEPVPGDYRGDSDRQSLADSELRDNDTHLGTGVEIQSERSKNGISKHKSPSKSNKGSPSKSSQGSPSESNREGKEKRDNHTIIERAVNEDTGSQSSRSPQKSPSKSNKEKRKRHKNHARNERAINEDSDSESSHPAHKYSHRKDRKGHHEKKRRRTKHGKESRKHESKKKNRVPVRHEDESDSSPDSDSDVGGKAKGNRKEENNRDISDNEGNEDVKASSSKNGKNDEGKDENKNGKDDKEDEDVKDDMKQQEPKGSDRYSRLVSEKGEHIGVLKYGVKNSKDKNCEIELKIVSPDNSVMSAHAFEHNNGTFTVYYCPAMDRDFNMFVSLGGKHFRRETKVLNFYGTFRGLNKKEIDLACKAVSLLRWHVTPGLLEVKGDKVVAAKKGIVKPKK